MHKIDKGVEPTALTLWRRNHAGQRYQQLSEGEPEKQLRQAIRRACTIEQHYLCAYCTNTISGEARDTVNEHLAPQQSAPNRTMEYNNIVASCKTIGQCDSSHKSQILPLTPLMAECETELKFKISGRVEGLTSRARETIRVLNLGDTEANNRSLIEKRKQLILGLLITYGIDASIGPAEDDGVLQLVVDNINEVDGNGRLEPFAPVLSNILRYWLDA